MKIKTQIFLIGLLLSTLPLAMIGVMLILFYNNELSTVAIDDLRSITSAQVEIIDNFFEERNVNLSVLTEYDMLHRLLEDDYEDAQTRTDDKAAIEEIFRVQPDKREFVYSITAITTDFKIVACTASIHSDKADAMENMKALDTLGKEIWFSHVLDAGEFGARERCLVAVKAIYTAQEQRIGYIVEEIALDYFTQLRIATKLVQEGTVYITDGKGSIITAGTSGDNRSTYVLQNDQRGEFQKVWETRDLTKPIGVIKYKIEGVTYLTSYGGFHNADWQILSTVCLDDILHTRETLGQVLTALVLVTVLLIFIINLVMQNTLSHPIERMVTTFSEIRDKRDFSKRITGISHNEIGVIAMEINFLLADIETTVTQQQEKLKLLKGRAERDSLTNLFNKNTIRDILTMKIDSVHVSHDMLAFVFVDIDEFKSYNTRFGHAGGDAVIQFVADLMRELSGDIAGRVGGDEFIMCLDSLSSSHELTRCMDNFLQRLRQGGDLFGNGIITPVHCSIGVAVLNNRMDLEFERILEQADIAMYQVKNSTKNNYHIITV